MKKPVDSIMSKVMLDNKRDLVRIYIFSKLTEKKIRLHHTELEMLSELYMRGGFENKEEREDLYKWCLEKKLRRSRYSFDNFISKFVKHKVILKGGTHNRRIDPEIIAPTQNDNVALQQFIININDLN